MSKIVNRTLDFFEAFAAQKRPMLLTDLMKVLDIPVSSCHDVLHALEERGYLYELRPRGGYYPTARLLDVAQAIVDHDPLLLRVQPVLELLRDELQEAVFLSKAKETVLTYVAVCHADLPLRLSLTVGDTVRNLYATSAGKALLGSLTPDALKSVLAHLALTPLAPNTITSKNALQKHLRESEALGWYLNREESIEDMWTASARFTWNGAIYVVTVAGSAKRMERKIGQVSAGLCRVAVELGQARIE